MAAISAAHVAKLREMTKAGLMDCKKALQETNGDLSAAVDVLRKKGIAKAVGKGERRANEGIIARFIQPDARAGILVEINCETDFVARNEEFQGFCDEVARTLLDDPQANLEERRTAQVAKMGENIQIARHHRMAVNGNGIIAAYIHTGAKIGVLVEVGASQEATVNHEEFKQLVRDITLQIAAANPSVVTRDQVPAAELEKEREIAAEQVKGKPPQAIAKIVEGKLEKHFQNVCLLEQAFVKNAEITVKDHAAALGRKLGDQIAIRRFVRFKVGEAEG